MKIIKSTLAFMFLIFPINGLLIAPRSGLSGLINQNLDSDSMKKYLDAYTQDARYKVLGGKSNATLFEALLEMQTISTRGKNSACFNDFKSLDRRMFISYNIKNEENQCQNWNMKAICQKDCCTVSLINSKKNTFICSGRVK